VPSNLIAWLGSFEAREFLTAPASETEVPDVDLAMA
jgi:hypothetical protein